MNLKKLVPFAVAIASVLVFETAARIGGFLPPEPWVSTASRAAIFSISFVAMKYWYPK